MMLNSMWGKFGQITSNTLVREFDDQQKFATFHKSVQHDVRYVSVLIDERVEIHYKHAVKDDRRRLSSGLEGWK